METAEMAADIHNPPPEQQPQQPRPPPPPPPGVAAAPPAAAAAAAAPPPSDIHNRKRPLDDGILARLVESPYYKMRAIVRDLRPHFIEVIRTPDFQNSKAAEEIREKMKVVVDLYREMIRDPPAGDVQHGQQHRLDMKPPERPPARQSGSVSQKQQQPEGTYIVGGSAFGWNFVTYPGNNKPIYYGRTKESYRSAAKVESQVQ